MNTIDLAYLVKLSVLVAAIVVGSVQSLKNFTKTQKGKIISIVSLVLVIVVALLNTSLVPQWVTVTVDVVLLSLSVSQLSWDVLAKAIPKAVSSLISKAIGSKSEDTESEGK